jgi:hypothetical protein
MTAVTSPAADLLPALIGIFVGAPVLAREFESGTNRFALTRGVGPLGGGQAAPARGSSRGSRLPRLLPGLTATWYLQPYRRLAATGQRWVQPLFDVTTVTSPPGRSSLSLSAPAGGLLVVSVLLGAATIWLVHRRSG